MANRLHRRALRKAARILGSDGRVRDMLGAPAGAYLRWLDGAEPMPEPVFRMLLDFLADMESESLLPQ